MKIRFLTSLSLSCILALAACKPKNPVASSPGGNAPEEAEVSAVIEVGKYPRTVQTWLEKGTDPVESSGNAVSPKLTERFFGELDWNSPAEEPAISLEIGKADWMHVQLTESSTEANPEWVAVWRKQTGVETVDGHELTYFSTFTSPPITEVDAALELLKSYAAQDKAYETAVEWKDLTASGQESVD